MKTSAGRRNSNNDRFPRRIELVRDLRVPVEKSNRRFRIGLADNLFAKATGGAEVKTAEPETNSEVLVDARGAEEREGFSRTELAVGFAAVAGLALGYLLGKRRK